MTEFNHISYNLSQLRDLFNQNGIDSHQEKTKGSGWKRIVTSFQSIFYEIDRDENLERAEQDKANDGNLSGKELNAFLDRIRKAGLSFNAVNKLFKKEEQEKIN